MVEMTMKKVVVEGYLYRFQSFDLDCICHRVMERKLGEEDLKEMLEKARLWRFPEERVKVNFEEGQIFCHLTRAKGAEVEKLLGLYLGRKVRITIEVLEE